MKWRKKKSYHYRDSNSNSAVNTDYAIPVKSGNVSVWAELMTTETTNVLMESFQGSLVATETCRTFNRGNQYAPDSCTANY
jgi:hypothetical protein